MKPEVKDETYNDLMNRWAAQQSFLTRLRLRLMRPNPKSPVALRFLGYVVRVVALVAILWGIYYAILKQHLKSNGFAEQIAAGAAAPLHAEDVKIRPFSWKGTRGVTKELRAKGAAGAFYSELVARGVVIEVPASQFLNAEWSVESVDVAAAEVLLRSGRAAADVPAPEAVNPDDIDLPETLDLKALETEGAPLNFDLFDDDPAPASEDPLGAMTRADGLPVLAAGMGVSPDLAKLRFKSLIVRDGNLAWGYAATTRGILRHSEITLTPPAAPGGSWKVRANGGTLRQNWLSDLNVGHIEAEVGDSAITIKSGEVVIGEAGRCALTGSIQISGGTPVDLRLAGSGIALKDLAPNAIEPFIAGEADVAMTFSGDLNSRKGLAVAAKITPLEGATLRGLPILNVLASTLVEPRFRLVPLTGGEIAFTTGEGKWETTALNLESKGVCQIVAELKGTRLGFYEGTLRIGIPPEKLASLEPGFRAEHFAAGEGGLEWLDVPLNARDPNPTEGAARALGEAFAQSREK